MNSQLIKYIRHRMIDCDIKSVVVLARHIEVSDSFVNQMFTGRVWGERGRKNTGRVLGIPESVMLEQTPAPVLEEASEQAGPAGEHADEPPFDSAEDHAATPAQIAVEGL